MGAPVRFQKAVSRSKESRSGAPRGAPVRVMGRQSRPLTGEAMPQGRPMGAAFRAREFRRSASLFLRLRRVRTDNLERQPAGMRRAATLPHGSNTWRKKRCRNLCRCPSTVMPGLVPGIHALLCTKEGVDGRVKPGHDER